MQRWLIFVSMIRCIAISCALLTLPVSAQQVSDTLFQPPIPRPMFPGPRQPVVVLDEAHQNFHTLAGRYRAFGALLERDGYVMRSGTKPFAADALNGVDVLVIANALHVSNAGSWRLPTPSAFSPEEIEVVKQWVNKGGSLFLIADHMPFAGAAHDLSAAFGVEYLNCYAIDKDERPVEYFTAGQGLDPTHPIVNGSTTGLAVDTVVTFTGSAFQLPAGATPILALSARYELAETAQAGQFNKETPVRSAAGWYQGAALEVGKGRVVIFGEAAMFSAQLAGRSAEPMGFNVPEAHQNVTLLRNIMAWLARSENR